MRILLANKYYYPRGGDCIYTIELEALLKAKGHEVGIFSMNHPSNLKSRFSKYFPEEIDFKNRSFTNNIIISSRIFGSHEIKKKFIKLIADFKPDILHLNNIHSYLSPALAKIAYIRGIPVVWTLHDYKLLCPRYDCLRRHKPCELCFYSKFNVIRYRCMKNSLLASLMAYLEAKYWNRDKISLMTDIFICPSEFMYNKMVSGGYNPTQLVKMKNFINNQKINESTFHAGDYYCYIGRLSSEKGIETLLKAAMELPEYNLKIIGSGPLEKDLRAKYKKVHIEFLGFKNWDELKIILESARFMIVPSEWYENNPLSIIESLCLGTPVIGAKIGGIPELITNEINGLLFETGNITELRSKIIHLWQHSFDYNRKNIAMKAREIYNSEVYYEKIMDLYQKLLMSSTLK